jgi:hypothetical protein
MKNRAAQQLVRLRNKKKGKQWRSDNARKAAQARWHKNV